MVISRYTIPFTANGKHYIYNSLSNSLLEIDGSDCQTLETLRRDRKEFDPGIFEKEFREILTEKHFIVEDSRDELLLYRASIQSIREQREFMHLTIAPTMDCNFRCFYCFEKHGDKCRMTEETMDSIVKYVGNLPKLKRMKLTWFGGEPLMAKEQMRSLNRKIRTEFHGDIDSDIITTGFYIDEGTPELFTELGISSVQITLDGNRKSHNKIKFTTECEDVFAKVISNAAKLSSAMPDITISFRVNITRENADEYPELYKYLYSIFQDKRISISPAIVKDKGGSNENGKGIFYDNRSFAQYILDLFNRYGIHTPFIRYPGDQICECAVRDKMAMAFDPEGYAYKCWEKIGDRKYAIGRLTADGILTDVNTRELNRELYGADPLDSPVCTRCAYLPICNGGCPMERIQNEFEGYHNDTCTFYKGRMDDFLAAHIMMKKNGFPNR